MTVTYAKLELSAPCNMVAWDDLPVNGKRPQIACKKGTTVRLRTETLADGSKVVTAFIRRGGKLWSNTRRIVNGAVIKSWQPLEFHKRVTIKQ